MKTRHRQSAFSLVEVMVAVFVLSVGLVGLARGITTALVSSKEAELYNQAVDVADNRLETIRADDLFSDGETEGDSGPFKWRQTIAPAGIDGLHQVEVAVERSGSPGTLFTLRTFLYLTPTETPGDRGRDPARERGRSRGDRRSRNARAQRPS